jgi:hypothetical protein
MFEDQILPYLLSRGIQGIVEPLVPHRKIPIQKLNWRANVVLRSKSQRLTGLHNMLPEKVISAKLITREIVDGTPRPEAGFRQLRFSMFPRRFERRMQRHAHIAECKMWRVSAEERNQ